MTTLELYTKGARIWVSHPDKVWEGAKVTESFVKGILKVQTDDGEVKELVVASEDDLPPLRNPDILIGENDLTSLSYLHEPAVLYNLEVRFCEQNAVYTYCGIVLVAINPYTEVSIYDPDTIWAYRGQSLGDLDPHIFAVAEEAYRKIEREQMNQSIIVSGESGAGKTMSAKYAMRYFATVGGSIPEKHVEKRVLASSPIMEAIGNAKTVRNDNSSRFGKYIELHFNKNYNIVGASMSTYLLEKSRVVFQSQGERNYHIFYQMCAARKEFDFLDLKSADYYNYLCDEDSVIVGVDDAEQHHETMEAFQILGFSDKNIKDIYTVLAAVLHLGNVEIVDKAGADAESTILPNDPSLALISNLIEINGDELRHWLCHRKIVSTKETFNKQLSQVEACGARDALAKHIYASLFSWIVTLINRALVTSSEAKHRFIGVLDIYGFETFETNSFEQFCINYANEKLQQQFNSHVFTLEQEEYLKENIEWKFIDFYNNQPCIDLIEAKLGILDLLDEECRMPRGSDNSWAEKLFTQCTKRSHFSKPRFGTNSFVIKHFADKVVYDVAGFLEKNKDTVIEDQVTVLKGSGNKLMQKLFNEDDQGKLSVPKPKVRISLQQKPTLPSASSTIKNKKTVGSQFRDSLSALMTTLNSTTPHYIRCIKPNDNKEAFVYNPKRAVQQLRACGVLETIRISAAGFPSRWLYSDFLARYRALAHSTQVDRADMAGTCERILLATIKDADKYKFGRTKIFFRAGQVAYLERLRSERLLACCIKIQAHVRGFLMRRRYKRTLKATQTIQRFFRGYLQRKRAEELRRLNAAVVIQKRVRGWVKRTQFIRIQKLVLGLQCHARGYLARKKFQHMRQNKAAIIIQANVRGWLARIHYRRNLKKVIICQSAIRRFIARRQFRKLKREARSADHFKKLNRGLENKIIALQQKIGELNKEIAQKKTLSLENEELKSKVEAIKNLKAELKTAQSELKERDNENNNLLTELILLRQVKSELENQVDELKCRVKTDKEIKEDNARLKEELIKLKNELNSNKAKEEENNVKVAQMEEEMERERLSYQKLLNEKFNLENRVEMFERTSKHKRSSSDASTASVQDEDVGYASVRSVNSSGREDTPTPDQHVDTGLVLKLQHKLQLIECENRLLQCKIDSSQHIKKDSGDNSAMFETLEIQNARLTADLQLIREAVASDASNGGNKSLLELTRQCEYWQAEAKRSMEEAAALKSTLGSRVSSASTLARSSYSGDVSMETSLINEDGELILAYEATKKTLRQVENEFQEKMSIWDTERDTLMTELSRLRIENERLRAILSKSIDSRPLDSKAEAFLQSEITRIVGDHLALKNYCDKKTSELHQLRDRVNHLEVKLKDAGVPDAELAPPVESKKTIVSQTSVPVLRKKEREFMGMFEIRNTDIDAFVTNLLELSPKVAITLLPGLPAYIVFMCVRYCDYANDDKSLHHLIVTYTKKTCKLVKKKVNDVDCGVLWLSNTLRLLHNLKQYSGDVAFSKENTQRQNEHCLKNFDLSDFRKLLSERVIQICQIIMKTMCDMVQPLAVGAILDHEAVMGITRPRSSSVSTSQNASKQEAMSLLLNLLSQFNRTLSLHGADPELHGLFFRQLFYFLCANSLNNLLLRREYCHWSRGIQIRYNLSHLEEWIRDEKIQDTRVASMLAPIIQASQLLQARKKDEDVIPIADMCSSLTTNQIIKLLHLYTPMDEDKVSESFIKKVKERLIELRGPNADNTLMMDVHKTIPLEFPFNPSSIRLEDIEAPEILNLPMLKKL